MIHVNQFQKLNLILGDQLNINHSWFKQPQPNVLFVLMEILPEQEYTTHHIQKIAGFFASMRRFAEQLMSKGYDVRYFKIDDSDNLQSFEGFSPSQQIMGGTSHRSVQFDRLKYLRS